jgi:uncharacterized protein (TIGR02145 family)
LWWNTTDNPLWSNFAARQWPCPSWRHVPSTLEWDSLVKTWFSSKWVSCTASAWSTCGWNWGASFANFQSNLKLSLAGSVSWTDGAVVSGPGYYWSSTPDGGVDTAYLLTFSSTSVNIQFGGNPRAAGASVRCFKN